MHQNVQPKLIKFGWLDTDGFTRTLAEKLVTDQYIPDVIVGILRGGCVPAIHLSHLLHVRPFYALHVQSTLSDEYGSEQQDPIVSCDRSLTELQGRRVLLVDDVTGSGVTLRAAKEYIQSFTPAELRSCALVWNTFPLPGEVSVRPLEADYCVTQAHGWVVYPWVE